MFLSPTTKKQPAALPKLRSPLPTAKVLAEPVASSVDICELFDFFNQNGSKEFPHIIMVNPEFPERNGPFLITALERKEVGNYAFNGFHVSTLKKIFVNLLFAHFLFAFFFRLVCLSNFQTTGNTK